MRSSTLKALDILGASFFAVIFITCMAASYFAFALGAFCAVLAFLFSWRHWSSYDWSEQQFHRTMCAIMALLSLILFAVGFIPVAMAVLA